MALLDVTQRLHQVYAVVHVNYHWRASANRDMHIVKRYCHQHHLRLFIKQVNPLIYCTNQIKNFEAWARQVRYNFFNFIANFTHHHYLLVAHHHDDYLESALMQIIEHKNLFHYGMNRCSKFKHLIINRPFLKKYTKSDLVSYCQKNHLSYGIDETNNDPKYFRNYVRMILAKNPTSKQILLSLIKQLNESLTSQFNKSFFYYKKWSETNEIPFLFKLSFNYQLNLLKMYLYYHHIKNLSQNKLQGIIGFLHSNLNQKSFRVAPHIFIIKNKKKFFLIKDYLK